jgi:hypothetical protein
MKDGPYGQCFPDNDAIITAVRKCVASGGAEFYENSMQALLHTWQICISSDGDYVERQYIFYS